MDPVSGQYQRIYHQYGNVLALDTVPSPETEFGQAIENLVNIYGEIEFTPIMQDGSMVGVNIAGETLTYNDFKEIANLDVYQECGFIEGQCLIDTPHGSAACVVKNGTLYPILSEYDQAIEDNHTLSGVHLNGDNEVTNLQQMLDQSGVYIAYDDDFLDDPWSPIENYLHQYVNMPIVPKIGFVPSEEEGVGDALPGLQYVVQL